MHTCVVDTHTHLSLPVTGLLLLEAWLLPYAPYALPAISVASTSAVRQGPCLHPPPIGPQVSSTTSYTQMLYHIYSFYQFRDATAPQ